MTIFYLLFYFYYRKQSGDLDNKKKWTIIILSAIRLVLLMLPQNNWGIVDGNYRMGIIRKIPFLIMGLLLIFWTYKKRKVSGLNNMSIWIFLSFAFYIPVVLWASKYPMVGALMMPKTIAYVLLILEGYKYYINEFKPENFYDISFTFLIMGLVAGVFYREFTKYFNFNGATHLGKLHVHALSLGFILIFILYLATRGKNREKFIKLKKPFMTYIVGLVFTIVTMTVYGIYDVVGKGEEIISIPMISGFSGLGHIILSIGLVWMLIKLKKNYEISYENSRS